MVLPCNLSILGGKGEGSEGPGYMMPRNLFPKNENMKECNNLELQARAIEPGFLRLPWMQTSCSHIGPPPCEPSLQPTELGLEHSTSFDTSLNSVTPTFPCIVDRQEK